MGTTAVIGLLILAWVLLAIPVSLFVARMIGLRDSQRGGADLGAPAEGESGDGAETFHTKPGWDPRSKP
ncbi:MAG: hypothetical protein ACREQ5_13835 [Candidatus Dormibacteria bacterium]